MKRLQSEICILLKRHADQWKLSHFKFSITQIHRPFLWLLLDLKLPNRGRKLKQSLEIPILTRELYVFTRKDLCLGKERSMFRVASRFRNIICLNSAFLRSIINTDGKVPQILKLNITQSYKQVIFSLEFMNILLSVEANPLQMRSQCV